MINIMVVGIAMCIVIRIHYELVQFDTPSCLVLVSNICPWRCINFNKSESLISTHDYFIYSWNKNKIFLEILSYSLKTLQGAQVSVRTKLTSCLKYTAPSSLTFH